MHDRSASTRVSPRVVKKSTGTNRDNFVGYYGEVLKAGDGIVRL